MKTRKALSFLLMIALLVSMNIAPGFALGTTTTKLTLEYNSEGGTVEANESEFESFLIDPHDEHNHDDGKCVIDYENTGCNRAHTHDTRDISEGGCYSLYKCGKTPHTHSVEKCGLKYPHKEHDHVKSGCIWFFVWLCFETEHTHKDSCYCCGKQAHTHSQNCEYKTPQLVCGKEEHTHSVEEGCYKCILDEHTHDAGCYDWPYATVIATASEGYYVASMTGTGNDESPEGAESYTSTFKMNEDRKVNVVFAKKTYIVNVESDNQLWGSVAVNGGTSATVEYDGSVTLTATASDGYRFVGWMEGNKLISDETPYELTNITSNLDIVGVFEEESAESTPEPTPSPSPAPVTYYTLNVEVEGPGSVTPASGSFTAGNRVVLLPTANEGARFVGWFGENGSEVDANNGIIMNGNKNLIARFELIAAEEAEEETENVEEFTDETVPESGNINDAEEEEVVVTEQEVTDQEVPYDGPALPQTGGIPMEVLMGAGLTLVTAGCSLLKKKKEDEE